MSVNKVILVGRLGKDPEIRYAPSGAAIANFSLATDEKFTKDGEKQEHTEWHRLVAFKRTAEIIGEYLKKGAQVYIEGKLQTRKWQDKDGQDRYTTEILVHNLQMLGSPGGGQGARQGATQKPTQSTHGADSTPDFDDDLSDIPFN